MFGLSSNELLVIFLIILFLFGAQRIPEIARAMGKGIRDFKRATRDAEGEMGMRDEPPPRPTDRSSTPGPRESS